MPQLITNPARKSQFLTWATTDCFNRCYKTAAAPCTTVQSVLNKKIKPMQRDRYIKMIVHTLMVHVYICLTKLSLAMTKKDKVPIQVFV